MKKLLFFLFLLVIVAVYFALGRADTIYEPYETKQPEDTMKWYWPDSQVLPDVKG